MPSGRRRARPPMQCEPRRSGDMPEQPGHERRAIWPGGIPKPIAPYSPAIKAGGWLFVAGQLASDFTTGLAPECKHENPYLGDALRSQSHFVLRTLAEVH